MTPGRAVVSIRGPMAEVVARTLAPEAGRDVPRSRVEIASVKGSVTITVDAEDVAAMRAALNSYLRWADVATRVTEEVRR